jgi:hypothetical protein
MQKYDYDGHNDLDMGSFANIRLVVGSISTPNAPSSSKSIATQSILDLEIEIACMGTTQDSIDLELEGMGFSLLFFSPLALFHLFTINDGNKVNHVQSSSHVVCHYAY